MGAIVLGYLGLACLSLVSKAHIPNIKDSRRMP